MNNLYTDLETTFKYINTLDCFIKNQINLQDETKRFSNNQNRLIGGFICSGFTNLNFNQKYIKLIYLISGNGEIKINGNSIQLDKQSLIMANSNTDVTIQAENNSELVLFLIKQEYLNNSFMNSVHETNIYQFLINNKDNNINNQEYMIYKNINEPEIDILVLLLLKKIVKMNYCHNEITYSACSLLLSEVGEISVDKKILNKSQLNRSTLVSEILNYCNNNIKNCSLKEISQHFKFHPNYISNMIKDETGKNLSYYIMNRRIDLAKELLINSDLSINQIIDEIGYSDKSFFYKQFNKYTGLSPKSYREKNLNNNI